MIKNWKTYNEEINWFGKKPNTTEKETTKAGKFFKKDNPLESLDINGVDGTNITHEDKENLTFEVLLSNNRKRDILNIEWGGLEEPPLKDISLNLTLKQQQQFTTFVVVEYKMIFNKNFRELFNIEDYKIELGYYIFFTLTTPIQGFLTLHNNIHDVNDLPGVIDRYISINSCENFFNLLSNRIFNIIELENKRKSVEKTNINLSKKIEEVKDCLNDLIDISKNNTIVIENNVIHAKFDIEGIRLEEFVLSKHHNSGSRYSSVRINVNESRFILTDKLLKVFDHLSEIKPRIDEICPGLEIKTYFKNNELSLTIKAN